MMDEKTLESKTLHNNTKTKYHNESTALEQSVMDDGGRLRWAGGCVVFLRNGSWGGRGLKLALWDPKPCRQLP